MLETVPIKYLYIILINISLQSFANAPNFLSIYLLLARPLGFEPTTFDFGDHCSTD